MSHPAFSQTDDTDDTTMTQLDPHVSSRTMTQVTQLSKGSLRARTRRQGFKTCVTSVTNTCQSQLDDTNDTSFVLMALTRVRTRTHAPPGRPLKVSGVICVISVIAPGPRP